jgi:hypothetical protein
VRGREGKESRDRTSREREKGDQAECPSARSGLLREKLANESTPQRHAGQHQRRIFEHGGLFAQKWEYSEGAKSRDWPTPVSTTVQLMSGIFGSQTVQRRLFATFFILPLVSYLGNKCTCAKKEVRGEIFCEEACPSPEQHIANIKTNT